MTASRMRACACDTAARLCAATTGGDGDGDLPVPVQKASAHARVYDDAGSACVLRYRHQPCCLLWDGKHQHPERLTPLNTSPAPSPVNASRLPSRTTRASLGASAVRYSFTVTDFHRLPFAGLPAHPSTASEAGSCTATNRTPHSITSSARVKNDSGIVKLSIFAVFRLNTSSNFVGCSTGISPGAIPRKILSTSSAARR